MMNDVTSRFLAKVNKANSGCWEWTSTLHRDGYGKFWFVNGQIQAHRMAYELFVGPCNGMFVLHKCDNRKCVNPEHLYLGDSKQNAKDRTDRKRYKVTTPLEIVEAIRREYATGQYSQQQLADKYGVRQTQVSRYVLNRQRVYV